MAEQRDRIPVIVMGLGIYLYGMERRVLRSIPYMPRLKPHFIISRWDLGQVSAELDRLKLPYSQAPYGYLGFARPRWLLTTVAAMPKLFTEFFRVARRNHARGVVFVSIMAFLNALPVVLLLRFLFGMRIVFYLGDIGGGTRTQRYVCKLADLCADEFVVNSRAVEEGLRKNGIRRSPITVVYNGLELERFALANPAEAPWKDHWPAETCVVGYVGQLTENKGILDFLEAARIVLHRNREIRFAIIGDSPDAPGFIAELKTLFADILPNLCFVGRVDAIERYYPLLDIVTVLSRHDDPAPNVNLEAMASGLPVIGTTTGGTPELIEDQACGILVPPRNPDAIAAAMIRLVEDPQLRLAMGQNGRRRAEERFNSRKNAVEVEAIILRAVDAGREHFNSKDAYSA